MQIDIVNHSHHPLPAYQTAGAAGMDVYAFLPQKITIQPAQRCLVPTGLHVAVPVGYEMQVRPRSGLALKHGITVLNSPGTIDSDYRGELKVLLINHGTEAFDINDGDRIAQLVVAKCEQVQWQVCQVLDTTNRASGGYGSTGVQQ